jgi:dTDP-4-amino-4,6-dideoxygalactose transaminase
MADMDAVMDIARRYKLKVVEDAAHQQGSRWRNVGAGAIGDAGSFSFQQSKVLTSGEGGAVVCNNQEVYETVFALKHVGWKPDLATPGYHYGHNYRATEMQAVLLRGGLRRLPGQLAIRERNVGRLREGLKRLGGPLRVAKRDERITRQSYYGMTMHYDSKSAMGIKRDDYCKALSAEGFFVGGTYPPVYRHPILNLYDSTSPVPFRDKRSIQNYSELKLPVTERVVGEEGVILSQGPLLGSDEYIDQLLLAYKKVNDNLKEVKGYLKKQHSKKK